MVIDFFIGNKLCNQEVGDYFDTFSYRFEFFCITALLSTGFITSIQFLHMVFVITHCKGMDGQCIALSYFQGFFAVISV